ncbi:ABC transporter substrate-binding protein [Natranaerobius trueperi]|uniref:SsuA/THI5-like domain-containing protein n=1 Tax=Natranaerobius trueperi TaxID=759412 RepID=A0A226C348_9FIRM|nr:MqnA/MqnD/SBP family protein [Natranaerobius trueperi]OWZ84837.1 hypothetical protein CDO51_00055 [Natranaerobius trueperi]
MKGIRIFGLFMLVLVLLFSVIGCGDDTDSVDTDDVTVDMAVLGGPTGMGAVQLIEQNELGDSELNYDFSIMGSPDDLVGRIINGEVDIAAVPTNLASVLYNRTEGDIQLAAVNTLGVLYVLESGDSITSIEDLEGEVINVSGQGATPDFALRYLLEEHGLTPYEDVELDFQLQHSDLAAATAGGDVDLALLPQPHVTTAQMRNDDLQIALDITEEWDNVADDSELAMGSLIVQKDFAKENPEVMDIFLDEYEESINFVNENYSEAAELMEKFEILPNKNVAKEAIPYSNIVFRDGQESKTFLQDFYQVLYDFEPDSVGGKLPDENFYYQR